MTLKRVIIASTATLAVLPHTAEAGSTDKAQSGKMVIDAIEGAECPAPQGKPEVVSKKEDEVVESKVKWNHIVIWHAVFCLFFRNVPYLLNFLSTPLSLILFKTCQITIWFHFR